MVRLIARAAVASALVAAVAAPLTMTASAGALPTLPLPVPALPSLEQTLNSLVPVPLLPAAPSTPSSSSNASANDSNSSASANALDVPALNTCIGCTSGSSSTPNSSTSNGTALKVLGINLSGGSSSAAPTTTNSASLLALPANPLVGLALADWIAAATSAPSSFERAALLDLNLNPDGTTDTGAALSQLATLAVLEGKSSTTASCEAGGAKGETNGANLNVGQGALVVLLLHADASTNSPGHVYLASINGTQILNSQQIGGNPIAITIPGLTTITLVANPQSGCGNGNPPPNTCQGVACIQLPPGTTLGNGFTATQTATSSGGNGNNGGPGSGVQGASVTTPSTGTPLGVGILGFLLIGGGLLALGASRVARRWRALA